MIEYVNECNGRQAVEWELDNEFQQMLNDNYEPVNVCGYEFLAGNTLKELDPIAYREMFLNWLDVDGWDEL